MDSKSPKKEKDILRLFGQDNTQAIEELLTHDSGIDLHRMSNSKQFTGILIIYEVLHFSCFNNNYELTKLVLEYCSKSVEISKHDLLRLLNAQNKEGFTPLHLASFKGNLQLIQVLLNYGADYTITNHLGLSVLHMSAQGDHVQASYFWIQKGIQIDIQDQNGSTPLCWGSFLGSSSVVSFLISWGTNINHATSDKQQTALHLATQQGHFKIVRKLLIKGINRDLQDNKGKTALDYAKDNRFKKIQFMIENKMGLAERCGIRQPYSKVDKQYTSLLFFLIVFISTNLMTILFTFPFIQSYSLIVSYLIIHSLTLLSFWVVAAANPGFVPRKHTNLMKLLEEHKVEYICADCCEYKPERSRHCETCQRCILNYDHHCPWLSNCVGAGNLKYFIVFLILLSLACILQITIQCIAFNGELQYTTEILDDHTIRLLQQITFFYAIILNGIFVFPILGLLTVQLNNIRSNQTQYEKYQRRKSQTRKGSQEAQSKTITPRSARTGSGDSRSTAESDRSGLSCCGIKKVNKQDPKMNAPLLETEVV